jgi:hypothetical protein
MEECEMTNPLDELRNTTKSIHQKQEDNLKKTKEQRLEQQQLLAKNSGEHQQQVQDDAKRIAEKSKRIKITIMSIVILLLGILFAFSIRMVMSGTHMASSKSSLASSDKIELDANDNEYIPLKKFIKKTLADLQKKHEIEDISWYSSLPRGRKERYFKILTTMGLNDKWSIYSIQKDPKRERFSVICKNGKKALFTLDIVYNDDMEFRIVKIY